MANNLSLSNVINISIQSTPLGLKQANLSAVAIFTTLQDPNGDAFSIHKNPDTVANLYGTSSEVYKQAVAIFSQSPNILNNSGYLVIIPLLTGVLNPATAGYEVTDVLNTSAFAEVTDGAFDISIDGENAVNVTGLNFTRAYTLEDFASLINENFTENETPATVSVDAGKLVFTSNTTGATSSVLLSAAATGTNLLSSLYFNGDACIAVQGIDATSGRETLVNGIQRTKSLIFYHGILVDYAIDDTEVLNASNFVQTVEKMLFISRNALNCCDEGELFDIIKNRTNTHTRCLAYFDTTDAQKARLFASAYSSRGLSVNFAGSNTALTLHMKELATIDPDPNITETLLQKARNVGADIYGAFEGVPAVFCNGANDFFDNVYNDNWLITDLQVEGFNCLRNAGSKIPQTEDGVATLVDAYRNTLKRGVNNGSIAPGNWTLPITFGDSELLRTNVATYGYYIYSTPLAQQSQADREERKAPYIQMAVKRAGAIHSSDVMVYINN